MTGDSETVPAAACFRSWLPRRNHIAVHTPARCPLAGSHCQSGPRFGCPVDVVFTGNINLNSPHPNGFSFNYYWVRSDGAKGPVNVVRPSPSQDMLIFKEPWTLGAAGQHYDLSVKLFVNSGNTHLEQTSQVVSVTCK